MAIDADKQVRYWRAGGDDAMGSAQLLIANGRGGFELFLAHLALEKALKALVVARTREVPPRIHDLLGLVRRAAISPPPHIMTVLGEVPGILPGRPLSRF